MGRITSTTLKPGALLFTDSGDAVVGGAIIMLDVISGERTTIATGLDLPLYLAIDPSGNLILSAAGKLVQIDLDNGQVSVLADASSPLLGYACGLAVDRHGKIVCANLSGVIAVDGDTFELERDRTGRHGNIMKYNLSRQPA